MHVISWLVLSSRRASSVVAAMSHSMRIGSENKLCIVPVHLLPRFHPFGTLTFSAGQPVADKECVVMSCVPVCAGDELFSAYGYQPGDGTDLLILR